MQTLRNFRNSLVVFALLAVALYGIWYSPITDEAFSLWVQGALLVSACAIGWDVVQMVVNGPDEGEEPEKIGSDDAALAFQMAAQKQKAELNEAAEGSILSSLLRVKTFGLPKVNLGKRSPHDDDYDPYGPATMD